MLAPPPTSSPDTAVDPLEKVPTTKPNKIFTQTINGKVYQLPENKPLYSAHGKWEWANGHEITSGDKGQKLGCGLEGQVILKVGLINETEVVYISKLTSVWDSFKMFFSSLYLNASSKYLRPLQGDCVPWIIGVNHCNGGRIGLAQDLPHPTGWREADMFLEESQKEAIIATYQRLHDRGILHGDAEYRHMLIGDDGKVMIIDFGLSCVVNPDEWASKAGLDGCRQLCLRDEMRKVKFLLNWKDSRETEFRLAKLRSAREQRDCAAEDAALKSAESFEVVDVPKEPVSEEEKENPDGGLRLFDVNQWLHCSDTWVAHRYEVERRAFRARLRKTPVPRPPIPLQKTTESTDPVTSVIPAIAEPLPAPAQAPGIQLTSAVSAGATDAPNPTVSSIWKSPLEGEAEEQKAVNGESTKAVPLKHGKGDEGDRPMRNGPFEDKPAQEPKEEPKKVNAECMKAIPLRYGKAGGSDEPARKRPFEEEAEKEKEQEQKAVHAERTEAVPLEHGNSSESGVPARKRPFEGEPEKEPEEEEDDKVKPTTTVRLRYGQADRNREPPRKCSGSEQENSDINRAKAVSLRHGKSDNSEPAKKRQKTTEASVPPTLKPFPAIFAPKQLGSQFDDVSMGSSTSFESNTSSESDEDDTMKVPLLLDDDAADPTPYELNPEACAFLRGEAARGLARFTTAKMRVRPLERQLDLESHDLEKSRSELLRIMLMLPKEDRTTLWTNMGQPDARTLLGLLPETPGSSKSTRDLIRIQKQLARREAAAASQANGSMPSRESVPGFLAAQKTKAKTSSKQKLHERLEIERKIDSLAMPPPPLPVISFQKRPSEVETPKTSSSTSNTPLTVRSSQKNAAQEGDTSQSSPTHSGSTNAVQSAATMHAYYEGMKKALAEAHEAHPGGIFSVDVPKEILALEGRSTRKYTIPDEPSIPPPGSGLVRSPAAFYNMGPLENTTLGSIIASKGSEAKRKREVIDSEDSKMVPIADEEAPDAKRLKTKNCGPL